LESYSTCRCLYELEVRIRVRTVVEAAGAAAGTEVGATVATTGARVAVGGTVAAGVGVAVATVAAAGVAVAAGVDVAGAVAVAARAGPVTALPIAGVASIEPFGTPAAAGATTTMAVSSFSVDRAPNASVWRIASTAKAPALSMLPSAVAQRKTESWERRRRRWSGPAFPVGSPGVGPPASCCF